MSGVFRTRAEHDARVAPRNKKIGARLEPDPDLYSPARDYFAEVLSSEQCPGPIVPSL